MSEGFFKNVDEQHEFNKQELAAIGDYLPEMRRSLSDQRILRTYLAIAFVAGLLVHIVAYLLRPVAEGGILGLIDDLLYALGFALWTGVVVSYFVQVLPEAKRRQIIRGLRAYEEAQRNKGQDQGSAGS